MRTIKDAVHSDMEASRSVYNWVVELCKKLAEGVYAVQQSRDFAGQ